MILKIILVTFDANFDTWKTALLSSLKENRNYLEECTTAHLTESINQLKTSASTVLIIYIVCTKDFRPQ